MQIDKDAYTYAGTLIAHPDTPPAAIDHVGYSLTMAEPGRWVVAYMVTAAPHQLILPPPAAPERTDGLWQQTCAELFLRDEGSGHYFEFNFAPSGAWAAYRFSDYRHGMAPLEMSAPLISLTLPGARHAATRVSASFDSDQIRDGGPWHIGLSMVIAESDGTKSYWALRHPPGKPDFHHKHCFAIKLPPPKRA